MELSIVIVSFNTREILKECLASIMENVDPALEYEVFVVDNNSSDGSVEMIHKLYPSVRLISNSMNRGFAVANNQAIVRCTGNYIMLLNSDTQILSGTAIKIISFMEARPQVGAVGCKLLNLDGSLQPSIYTFPYWLKDTLSVCMEGNALKDNQKLRARLGPFLRLFGVRFSNAGNHAIASEIDFPQGACLTVRRKVVERIGLLDEGYFFAGEEADWCYRMKGKGWKVYYYPEASVIHHRRGSCKGMEGRAFIQTRKSALRFYEKHYGRWETELMRSSVSIVLFLKMLGTGFRLMFSSDRQKLLARIEVYLAVLRLHYDRNFRAMNMFYEVPYLYN